MPTFSPSLIAVPALSAELVLRKSKYYSIDDEVLVEGVRRILPLIAYAKDVTVTSQVSGVPLGRTFIMSDRFSDTAGTLFSSGAGPGYIGYKLGATVGAVHYEFRKPEPFEAIWYGPERCLYRYENEPTTNSWSWKRYRSLPQRALDGLQVFEPFDPDKVYDYVATLVGAMQSQLHIDNRTLSYLFDADRVPDDLISALAATLDADYEASYSEAQRRASISTSVAASRLRGFDSASSVKMLATGYKAVLYEVWELIDWPQLVTDNVNIRFTTNDPRGLGSQGFDGAFDLFAGQFYFYQWLMPTEGQWFELTDVSASLTQRFSFGSGSGIIVPLYTSADTQEENSAATMANARAAVNAWRPAVAAYNAVNGPHAIVRPHNYSVDVPRGYWPSRFLCAVVTDAQDNPITDLSQRSLWRRRLMDLIPVHARLRDFGTKAPGQSDGVTCGEAFTAALV